MSKRSHKEKILDFLESEIEWNNLMISKAKLSDHIYKSEKIGKFEARNAQAEDVKQYIKSEL